jgi:hypothetical protein
MWMGRSSRLLVVFVCAACTIDAPDLEGLSCPCAPGFVCDEGVCVRSAQDCTDDGAVAVTDLHAEWVTANTVSWAWTASTNPSQLAEHRLFVALSEEDVIAAACGESRPGAIEFGPSDNPELARAFLPRTSGEDPVERTIADGLALDTAYFAQLVVIDTASRTTRTNVARARTGLDPLTGDQAIAAGESGPAYTLPGCVAFDGSEPADFDRESGSWSLVQHCPANDDPCDDAPSVASQCWENVRLADSGETFSIGDGGFANAYFEFAVRIDGPEHSYWSETWIRFGGCRYGQDRLTLRGGGEYRRYQIPLSALKQRMDADACPEWTGRTMRASDVSGSVSEVAVGGQFSEGAVIRADGFRVRW